MTNNNQLKEETSNSNLISIKRLGVIIGRSKSYINVRLRRVDAPKPVVKGKPAQIFGQDHQFNGSTSNLYNQDELLSYFKKLMEDEKKPAKVKENKKTELEQTLALSRSFLTSRRA